MNIQIGDEVLYNRVWHKVTKVRPSQVEPGKISPFILGDFKRPSSIEGHRPMTLENI